MNALYPKWVTEGQALLSGGRHDLTVLLLDGHLTALQLPLLKRREEALILLIRQF